MEKDMKKVEELKSKIKILERRANHWRYTAGTRLVHRQIGSKDLERHLQNGLDSHLSTVLDHLTKFGVLLNKKGLLTHKMKFQLFKDFEGVKDLYGVIGLRISKSIEEIIKDLPIEEEPVYTVVSPAGSVELSPVEEMQEVQEEIQLVEDNQMVDGTPKCSELWELVSAVGFSSKDNSSNCVIATEHLNNLLNYNSSESRFDRLLQESSVNSISELDVPKSSFPDMSKHSHNSQSQPPRDPFLEGNEKEMDEFEFNICDIKKRLALPNVDCDPLKMPCDSFSLQSEKRKREVVSTAIYCVPDTDHSRIKRQKCKEATSNPFCPPHPSTSKLQLVASEDLLADNNHPIACSDLCCTQDDGYCSCSPPSSSNFECGTMVSLNSSKHLVTSNLKATLRTSDMASHPALKGVGKPVVNAVLHYNNSLQSVTKKNGRINVNNLLLKASLKEVAFKTPFPSLTEDRWIELAVQSLSKILINPKLISDKSQLLFHVFHYVYASSVSFDKTPGSLFSLCRYEKVVVAALSEVEARNMEDLLPCAIESLHLLIISKPDLNLFGLCALCRFFTELCRRRNLVQKPVLLAADLLKARNMSAPVMIASMVGVWSEPFEVTEAMPDEEKCLHSAIAFGVSKSCGGLPLDFGKVAMEVLSKHICPVPDSQVIQEVVDYLGVKIQLKCVKELPVDSQHTLMTTIVIYAAFSEWDWTQKNILDKLIVPSLLMYGQEENEAAFGMFSYLYAEIFSFHPEKSPDMLLRKYLEDRNINGKRFVKDCAAVALIRLLVLQGKAVSGYLLKWLQENSLNSKAESLLGLLLKMKDLTLTSTLTNEDIII